jgi:FMN reductase
MTVLLIAGSPSNPSRSAALLDAVEQRLHFRGVQVERLQVRDLSPQALLLADFGHPSVVGAVAQVARARAIVVATPVYKAAYSGVLKVFLDLLPQTALKEKHVLPLATGGSPNHMLALDYALRPVLQSLGAAHILPGIYATDSQVVVLPEGGYHIHADIAERLDVSVKTLIAEALKEIPSVAGRFAPVHFSQVRCSV